ncbi:myrcene synthase, chloroplastic-like [Cannabis sativa]|uniref:myrcene synthase, chloroplastic-like n=1 Tax=Cannabis sativa TaxID=3483 RepID=UPI0029C9DCFC|nr:myrcene synthase, chloroplastic-like [Cannabis sativa]
MHYMAVHQFGPSLISSSLPCISTNNNHLICKYFTPKTSISPISKSKSKSKSKSSTCYPIQCTVVNNSSPSSTTKSSIVRRSANYEPPIWSFDYIQSLSTQYKGESYTRQLNKLKKEVKRMLLRMEINSLALLELIDTLQRLGISYHFKNEINTILKKKYTNTYINNNITNHNCNLYAIALEFRLLRQHGYAVPQEIFNIFKDMSGKFKAIINDDDIMGILALYEVSFYEKNGESILEEARVFTTKCLENYLMIMKENKLDDDDDDDDDHNNIIVVIRHALELPLHWRTARTEAKWFIDVYEKRQDMNSTLLEFAKLDFNMVQSMHQDDLKHLSRWWSHTKLGEKLNFVRDRLMGCFLWNVGLRFEPDFSYFRRISARIYVLITIIDDIYDVYGTLEELELFTRVVERWDVKLLKDLPDYMKMPFLVLHNTINEMALDVLKEKHFVNIECLKKTWVDMCRSFLQEAKWYYNGYTPTFQEYIENGWISVGAPIILVHAYFSFANPITKEVLEIFQQGYPTIIRQSAMIVRLANDLATSSEEFERGDSPKSIQCYMQDHNVSKEEAREYIKFSIRETWKEMNSTFNIEDGNSSLVDDAKNFARMGLFMYQHGDGHSSQDNLAKERISKFIINPIDIHDFLSF